MTTRILCLREGDIVDTKKGWLKVKGYNAPYVEVNTFDFDSKGQAEPTGTKLYTCNDIRQRASLNVDHVMYCF